MRWTIAAVLALQLCVTVAGCRDSFVETAPPSRCSAVGEQCDLGQGVLGVCFDVNCAPGTPPPCFACAKQH